MKSKIPDDTNGYKGFFNGTMIYSYDKSTGYSYRRLSFRGPDGVKMPTETFICAAHEKDVNDRVYMRLNDCDGKCAYTPLKNSSDYYGCDELDPSGSFGRPNYYITSQKFSADGKLESFETDLNTYTVSDVKIKTFTKAPDYFEKCISKDCDVEMDFVFSIDNSGSMSVTRIDGVKNMINTIVKQFSMHNSTGPIASLLITWENDARIFHSDITLQKVLTQGFITSYTKFKADIDKISKKSGVTCLSCGLKSAFDAGYVNYVFEFNKYKQNPSGVNAYRRFTKAGHVGIVLSDGAPNRYCVNFKLVTSSNYTSFNWKGTTSSGGSTDLKNELSRLHLAAKTFYSTTGLLTRDTGNGIEEFDFYKAFTVIAIGAYEASGSGPKQYFQLTSLRAEALTPSFAVVYSISSLSNTNAMSLFYEGLRSDICSGFSGVQDSCTNLATPCCKGDPNCPYNDYDFCKEKEPYFDPVSGICIYMNLYSSKCRKTTCDPATGRITDHGPNYPETKMKPCFNYTCDDINGWHPISSTPINCGNLLNNKDTCKIYTCDTAKEISWNEWPQYENSPEKYSSSNTCKFTDVCTIKDCKEYHVVPGVTNEANCKSPNKWEGIEEKCYKLVPVDGQEKDCLIYSCSVVNGQSNVSTVSVDCGNKCKHCVYNETTKKNECPLYDACEHNYRAHPMGCWTNATCVEALNNGKGDCVEPEYLCDKFTDFCTVGKCNRNASDDYLSGECVPEPVDCTLPSHLRIGGCYDITCLNEKGGCVVIIDFSKLNECGDCGEYNTCDESALVITAAIGAGVVAAIVVIAIVALSVGLIASKKMYDMITGANEARMDAASENQLYKSADKGGSNPLFD